MISILFFMSKRIRQRKVQKIVSEKLKRIYSLDPTISIIESAKDDTTISVIESAPRDDTRNLENECKFTEIVFQIKYYSE